VGRWDDRDGMERTCLGQELAYATWGANSSADFGPLEVGYVLGKLEMLCEKFCDLSAFLTTQFFGP